MRGHLTVEKIDFLCLVDRIAGHFSLKQLKILIMSREFERSILVVKCERDEKHKTFF